MSRVPTLYLYEPGQNFLQRVFAQPYDYHVRHHSSELLASLETRHLLAFYILHQWLQTIAAVATGLALLLLLFRIDPLPALVALALLDVWPRYPN